MKCLEWVDDWYGDYSTDDQTDPEGALEPTKFCVVVPGQI